MRRPVKISSLASGAPRIRGRSWVPPIPGKIPSVVSGTPNTAVSLATMKSERTASSQPPARAKPSTAAITGTGQRSTRNAACSKITCWARQASSVISLRSLRSPPAQNARSPAPVKTTARTRESRRSPSKQARRSSPIAVFIAFIASGRFSVTVTTKPSAERSTSRCRYCAVSVRATARSLAEKKLATLQRNWPLGLPVARRRHWLNSCFPSTRPEPRGWHRVCGVEPRRDGNRTTAGAAEAAGSPARGRPRGQGRRHDCGTPWPEPGAGRQALRRPARLRPPGHAGAARPGARRPEENGREARRDPGPSQAAHRGSAHPLPLASVRHPRGHVPREDRSRDHQADPRPDRAQVRCRADRPDDRSEEHTSELQSPCNLVCRLLLEKKK